MLAARKLPCISSTALLGAGRALLLGTLWSSAWADSEAPRSPALRQEVLSVQEDPDRSTHTRFRQHHDGVRIWGGDGILHAREDGSHYLMTNPIGDEVAVNTNPSLPPAEALWIVARDLQSKGAFAKEPRLELVILPETVRVHRVTGLPISAGDALNAMAVVEQVVGYRLA